MVGTVNCYSGISIIHAHTRITVCTHAANGAAAYLTGTALGREGAGWAYEYAGHMHASLVAPPVARSVGHAHLVQDDAELVSRQACDLGSQHAYDGWGLFQNVHNCGCFTLAMHVF